MDGPQEREIRFSTALTGTTLVYFLIFNINNASILPLGIWLGNVAVLPFYGTTSRFSFTRYQITPTQKPFYDDATQGWSEEYKTQCICEKPGVNNRAPAMNSNKPSNISRAGTCPLATCIWKRAKVEKP